MASPGFAAATGCGRIAGFGCQTNYGFLLRLHMVVGAGQTKKEARTGRA